MNSIIIKKITLLLTAVVTLLNIANAQEWNPQPGWKDSYAVEGKCYCDSNGYDHNLDSKSADTPIGIQNVVAICEAIESVLGDGPTNGRIPYNDIQCGNGPANDAADEAGCPGRVDIGPEGCDQIGPKWDLETVYANIPVIDQGLDRSNWILFSNYNNNDVDRMIDNSASTRWSTKTQQTAGQIVTIDLSESLEFNRIVLDSSDSPNDYPRSYSVFVSSDGTNWGTPVLSGVGNSAIITIDLPDQNAQHIQIKQTGSSQNYWWSIHELKLFNDENSQQPPSEPLTSATFVSPIINLILDKTN